MTGERERATERRAADEVRDARDVLYELACCAAETEGAVEPLLDCLCRRKTEDRSDLED